MGSRTCFLIPEIFISTVYTVLFIKKKMSTRSSRQKDDRPKVKKNEEEREQLVENQSKPGTSKERSK